MIALPIAVEPKVTTKPNSSSPSAVAGERSAKIRCAQAAGIERRAGRRPGAPPAPFPCEVDREQPEQRHAQETRTGGAILPGLFRGCFVAGLHRGITASLRGPLTSVYQSSLHGWKPQREPRSPSGKRVLRDEDCGAGLRSSAWRETLRPDRICRCDVPKRTSRYFLSTAAMAAYASRTRGEVDLSPPPTSGLRIGYGGHEPPTSPR